MKNVSYKSSVEYISDHLRRINYALRIAISLLKGNDSLQQNILPGIVYSPEGILHLLDQLDKNITESSPHSDVEQFLKPFKEKEKELRHSFYTRVKVSANEGKDFPFEILKNTFNITEDIEIDMLLLCLAPYVDARYEIIYGYIHDDLTKKYPTLQLIFDVLTEGIEERLEIEKYYSTDSPLFRWQILKYGSEPGGQSVSTLFRPIYVDEPVVNFLLSNSGNISVYSESLPYLCFYKSDGQFVRQLDELNIPVDKNKS